MSTVQQFPKRVIIHVNHAEPERIAVKLCFHMKRKNDFHLVVFPDSQGHAEVTAEDLLKAFDEERSTFLMDYSDPRIDFSGRVGAKVMSPGDLERALNAFKLYADHLSYPDDYEDRLVRSMNSGRDDSSATVGVTISYS